MRYWKPATLLTVLLMGLAVINSLQRTHADEAKEDTTVYELRTYTTNPGKLDALHARFRDHTMRLFEKHGMKNIAYWTPLDKPETLVYIVSHNSRDAAKQSWSEFLKDPQWQAAYKESIAEGKLVKAIDSQFLSSTNYSPLK